jgi:hypothetical protein
VAPRAGLVELALEARGDQMGVVVVVTVAGVLDKLRRLAFDLTAARREGTDLPRVEASTRASVVRATAASTVSIQPPHWQRPHERLARPGSTRGGRTRTIEDTRRVIPDG